MAFIYRDRDFGGKNSSRTYSCKFGSTRSTSPLLKKLRTNAVLVKYLSVRPRRVCLVTDNQAKAEFLGPKRFLLLFDINGGQSF